MKLLRRGIDIQSGRDVNLLKTLLVKDHMTRDPEILPQGMPLREVVSETSRDSTTPPFPLPTNTGSLIGMVSLRDFQHLAFDKTTHDHVTVADIATTPAVSITPLDNLGTALSLINDNDIRSLPVIRADDDASTVVGILTQRDILAAYDKALESRGLKELILNR